MKMTDTQRGLHRGCRRALSMVGATLRFGPGTRRLARGKVRRGISSLELVLVLPLFLFITALIYNYGTAAAWKIRSLVASRDVVWKSRWPRSNQAPQPVAWPAPAIARVQAADDLAILDFPPIHLPVARGPLPAAIVDSRLLDPTRGAIEGKASHALQQPLPPRVASVRYDVDHLLLDETWVYDRTKLKNNVERRIKVLYELAKAPTALSQAYVQAVIALYYAAYSADLAPLDREPDFPRFGSGSPNFYPRLSSFCGLDLEDIDTRVEQLIDRIRGNPQRGVTGVPERMTSSFLSLYRGVIDRQTAGVKAELRTKISQLEGFLAQLKGS